VRVNDQPGNAPVRSRGPQPDARKHLSVGVCHGSNRTAHPSTMSCAAQKSQPFTGEIEKNASAQRYTAGRLGRHSGFAEMGF
jgi:hypothetical protein